MMSNDTWNSRWCGLGGKGLLFLLMVLLAVQTATASPSPKTIYINAEKKLNDLMQNKQHQKYRDKWLGIIDEFYDVYEADPGGAWAAAGLYKAGSLYLDLYAISWLKRDQEKAASLFEKIIKEFPKSRYHFHATKKIASNDLGHISGPTKLKIITPKVVKKVNQVSSDDIASIITHGHGDVSAHADDKRSYPESNGKPALVTGVRFWSTPSYTRVVVDTEGEPTYSHHMLKKDTSLNKPQRLFIDLLNSRIDQGLKRRIPINDHLLKNVRAGQYTRESARVVIDIKSYDNYKVFSLRNPFRIVIDVWGKKASKEKITASISTDTPIPEPSGSAANTLARQLALGVKTIVIDPGHGGKDYGAPGYLKGVHEKHITLALGLILAKRIRQTLNCEVIMTRTDDRYITLEERTAIANTKNADLFISIHTNANRDRNAYGIETYFLNLATDEAAISVAARENATSTKNISDLQSILDSLMQNSKINESSRLAGYVQDTMTHRMKQTYSRIRNKGVKQAPFYVLLGAQMPAILIETSFISNPRECKRLTSKAYQEALCDAIINGIKTYIKTTNPTALYQQPPLRTRS